MKAVIGISLLTLLAFQVFLKVGIVGYYGMNRDYITAKFCENVSKPEMRCNGKCYLKKQLKKADESGHHPQVPQKERIEAQPYVHFTNELTGGLNTTPVLFSNSISLMADEHFGSIFHPPAV